MRESARGPDGCFNRPWLSSTDASKTREGARARSKQRRASNHMPLGKHHHAHAPAAAATGPAGSASRAAAATRGAAAAAAALARRPRRACGGTTASVAGRHASLVNPLRPRNREELLELLSPGDCGRFVFWLARATFQAGARRAARASERAAAAPAAQTRSAPPRRHPSRQTRDPPSPNPNPHREQHAGPPQQRRYRPRRVRVSLARARRGECAPLSTGGWVVSLRESASAACARRARGRGLLRPRASSGTLETRISPAAH